mgnify:CR=1 FL=1
MDRSVLLDPASALHWIGSLFLLVLILHFTWRLVANAAPTQPIKSPLIRRLGRIPLILFLLILAYQARWQLAGFMDPDFLAAQRGFDPRGDLVGNRFHRGEILDVHGKPLAQDVRMQQGLSRSYALGGRAVHLIGYHDAVYGATGLERELDDILMARRMSGWRDAVRLLGSLFVHRTLHGHPVHLTLAEEFQAATADLLGGKPGAIVVIDPRDGSVLAMVSCPSFDPQGMTPDRVRRLREDADSPFLNRALQGLYPPGSTFKVLDVMLAFEHGIAPEFTCSHEGFYCGPADPVLHDFEHDSRGGQFGGHGRIGLETAFEKSCNVYFANLAERLGSRNLMDAARRAGFDRPIVPVNRGPSSMSGRLPNRDDLHIARTVRVAIGQDAVLVTPMHLAMLAAAVASGGTMFQPRYLLEEKPIPYRYLTDSNVAEKVAQLMVRVVESGTGRAAAVDGVVVGGKTGTAENATGQSHALFIGFAPWPQPTIAFAIVLEQGGQGGRVAAPIAGALVRAARDLGVLTRERFHDGR